MYAETGYLPVRLIGNFTHSNIQGIGNTFAINGTVAMVTMDRTPGAVNRNQVMVYTQSITLGIPILKEPALKHLVE